jgi:hypothetical protein
MVLFTYYNAVGEIASFRGVEYSKYIDGFTASFDRALPVIPAFVFPYIAVYALPALFLGVALQQGFSMGAIRRFFVVQIIMIFTAFACYLAFPVETDLLTDPATGEIDVDISSTWLHRLNYRFVHCGISKYVACPSMHNAHAWAIAFAFASNKMHGRSIVAGLAVLTVFSTIFTKAHPVPHLPFGIGLAALFHNYVYKAMQNSGALDAKPNNAMRMALIFGVPVMLQTIGEGLARISGWHINIPFMLGLDHRMPGGIIGLYGF